MKATTIENCFDSHVHWLATGRKACYLDLTGLKSAKDIQALDPQQQHYLGEWLMGFGWDQNRWEVQQFPSQEDIGQKFARSPVSFIRADGHAVWVNETALNRIADRFRKPRQSVSEYWHQVKDPQGGIIVRDANGRPTGVFVDAAKEQWIDALLPNLTEDEIAKGLLAGQDLFNHSGFTHIRDMSCNKDQWQVATGLDKEGQLSLQVFEYFDAEDPEDFESVLELALWARHHQTEHVQLGGVKTYLDGALGSEGAFISTSYQTGRGGRGFTLMDFSRLCQVMKLAFLAQMPLALHVIGDAAADWAVRAYGLVTDEIRVKGELHLEHVQMLQLGTIRAMRGQNICCHLQPCHWLSDSFWLEEKLGPLFKYCFPWAQLERERVIFDFGSDSPIEPPSIDNNAQAISRLAAKNILPPQQPFTTYHQYHGRRGQSRTYSQWDEEGRLTVVFEGRVIIQNFYPG